MWSAIETIDRGGVDHAGAKFVLLVMSIHPPKGLAEYKNLKIES